VVTNFRAVRDSLKSRNTRHGIGQLLLFLCVSVTMCFLLLLVNSHRQRFDFTQSRRYTLDAATRKVLANLQDDIQIVCCYGMGDMMWRLTHEKLIAQYSALSDRVKYEFINPTKEPEKVLLFRDELIEDALPAIFVRNGSRFERARDAKEQYITNAIIRVTRKGTQAVYFLQGHGERDIHSTRDAYALGFVKTKLEEKGYAVKELDMQRQSAVPTDCSVLIIAAPQTDLPAFEIEAIGLYLETGGSVLILLEPETVPDLVEWLTQFGVLVGNDIVCETEIKRFLAGGRPRGEVSTSIRLTLTRKMYSPSHPITRDFQLSTEYVGCRSVSTTSTGREGIEVLKLLETKGYMEDLKMQGSWAETNIDLLRKDKAEYNEGQDIPGPVTIAAAVSLYPASAEAEHKDRQRPPKRGSLIVFGDADFPTNGSRGYGGAQLFLNSVSHLCGEEDLVNVRHKSIEYTDLEMTPAQRRTVSVVAVFVLPLVLIIPGTLVWLKGRRA
ncbi:MAG TPA: GldG family protein, partial [bacterium]|nr:GldG family protein [bacterium]